MMIRTAFVCIAGLLTLGGCAKGSSSSATSSTRVTSATPISERAITALAVARCDREATCDNIGNGKTYANREACMSDVRAKGLNDLTTSSCPNGIDAARLRKCLADIRGERCANPIDTLGRINSCATDALCPK